VPQNLSMIIMKLIEKLPSKRYQTPLELKEALIRVQHSLEPTVIGGEDLEATSFRDFLLKEPNEESSTQKIEGTEDSLDSKELDSTHKVLDVLSEGAPAPTFALSFLEPRHSLLRVVITSEKKVIITGSQGMIYQSNDLGVSWERLDYKSRASFYSLWSNAEEQIICGEGGLLLRLHQQKLQELNSQTSHTLYTIWGGNRGLYIAGEHGTLLRKSGDVVFVLKLGQSTLFAGCQSAFGDLFVVGKKGTIFRSTDYGFTWHPKPSNTENDLHAIIATKSGELIVVGKSGTVLCSVDRGQTWSQVQSPFFEDLYDVDSTVGGVLYAVGSHGTILQRPSGAPHWRKVPGPTTKDLFSVSSLPDNNVVIVGDEGVILFSSGD
jgi:photosystem II stability/assembly factor-like uncharacterized protein